MLHLRPERDADVSAVEALLDAAFGPHRQRKISYLYRIGIPRISTLCLVAEEAGRLVGTIRYWPIRIDNISALLLGPVATDPTRRAVGIGRALIFETLSRATDLGWPLVFLVGDHGYYRRFGFAQVPPSIVMPGEDRSRVHWRSLAGGALPPSGGEILRADGTRIQPWLQRGPDCQEPLAHGDGVGHRAPPASERGGEARDTTDPLEVGQIGLDREHRGAGDGKAP